MTKGNIAAIIFLAVLLAVAITIKVKYSGRVVVTNETSETIFRDGKQLERDLLRGTPTKEDWQEIEKTYDRILEEYPDSKEVPFARLKLAQLYSRGYSEHPRAAEELRAILADYPADENITRAAHDELLNVGTRIAKDGQDKQEAIRIFDDYLELFPNSRKAEYLTYFSGLTYEKMGLPERASDKYNLAISEFPDGKYTAKAMYRLAIIGLNSNDGKARKLLMNIVKEHPGTEDATLAEAKLADLGVVNIDVRMDQYYLKYYGTKRPFQYEPLAPLNSWEALSAITEENLDARKYDIITSIDPEDATIEIKGTLTLANRGDEKSAITLQLNGKMGKLIFTSGEQQLEFERDGNLVKINLPDPLAKGDTLDLAFESMGAIGTSAECTISETGYALPQFAWYPTTLPGDEFTCDLEFHTPQDVTLRTIGDKDIGQPVGITKWKVKDPVTGIFFFYGKHHQDDKMSNGIEASYIKPGVSETRTKDVFEALSSIYSFYETALGSLPTKKIIIIETPLSGDFAFIDAPGVIIFDQKQIAKGIPLNLLAYAVAHQYFGISVPRNPSPEWTPFLSQGLQAYLEIFHMKDSGGEDAMLQRLSELREIYMATVESVGDQSLSAPGADKQLNSAFFRVKAPLVMEMLRQALGSDLKFVRALGSYYSDSADTFTGLPQLVQAFNDASGTDWNQYFDAWVNKSGLPNFQLGVDEIAESDGDYTVPITITQSGNPVAMPIDVLFKFADEDPETETAEILYTPSEEENGTGTFTQDFTFEFSEKPIEIILDPENKVIKDPASKTGWKEE